jgi:hypothetical protein
MFVFLPFAAVFAIFAVRLFSAISADVLSVLCG